MERNLHDVFELLKSIGCPRQCQADSDGLVGLVAGADTGHARPSVSTSKVVTALTSTAGGRKVTLVTIAPTRTYSVCAATKPRVA